MKMGHEAGSELVSKYWSCIKEQRWDDARDDSADEFDAYWPQSNEKFTRDNFIEMNRTYPGTHEIQVQNQWGEHDQWDHVDTIVTEVHIKSETPEGKEVEPFALSIFEVEDDGYS